MTTHPVTSGDQPPSSGVTQWPNGAGLAAAFTFDVDAESAVLWGSPQTGERMSVVSHQAYGPLVGVPRILELLARHQIRSTFFVPGYTAHRYPDTVRRIVDEGHEIAHHGYLHEQPTALTEQQEIDAIDQGLAALEEVASVRPRGYRAPMWDLSWRTPGLLLERGFLYDSSLMDADSPYELAVADSSLVEIPIHWALDDWEQYCFLPEVSGSGLIELPSKAAQLWRGEFHAMRDSGGCWVLTNHPFLSGRPSRAAALAELMGEVVACPDVWVAPLGEIAEHVRSQKLTPRSVVRPSL